MKALRTFKGRVVRFWPDRGGGYGFIRLEYPASTREARFVLSECDFGGDEIKSGDRVEMYLEDHAKGLRAIRVSKPGGAKRPGKA
jgi:cold shock CspA family protein